MRGPSVTPEEASALESHARTWAKKQVSLLRGGADASASYYYVGVAALVLGLALIGYVFLQSFGSNKPSRVEAVAVTDDPCAYETIEVSPCSGDCDKATKVVQQVSRNPDCPAKDPQTVSCKGAESPDCNCSMDKLKALLASKGVTGYTFCGSPGGSSQPSVCDLAQGGDKCYLGCDSPNRVQGEGYATCLSTGDWELAEGLGQFACVPDEPSCPDLYNNAASWFSGTCVNAKPGDKCFMNCHAGNAPDNDVIEVQCGADFQWSPQTPTCNVQG